MPRNKGPINKPEFKNEDEEAAWWAGTEGRAFLKQQTAPVAGKRTGSPLVTQLNKTTSVQIALRLPAPDIAQARKIAERKGIGYQTLLRMLVHEGLERESRRQ